jgi:hypothetical protein
MRATLILILCLLMAGCHQNIQPAGTIERQKFITIYCDLLQESVRSRNSGADPKTAEANADSILARNGVTRAEFDSTTRWFNADVRRWRNFFDEAAKELESRDLHPATQPR